MFMKYQNCINWNKRLPCSERASRKIRDDEISWRSEELDATVAAAAAPPFFSSTISSIPRTLEAQNTIYGHGLLLNLATAATEEEILEVEATTKWAEVGNLAVVNEVMSEGEVEIEKIIIISLVNVWCE